jgi:glycerol-3-phosphate O-acyltransferase
VGNQALSMSEIRDVLDPLLDYVDRRRLPLTEPSLLRQEAGVLRTLEELVLHGVLTRSTEGTEPVYAIGPDQHLVAAFYRNGAIHFFVNRAVGELALARLADGEFPDPMAEAWAEALRLRDLLKFEFFFPRRREYADQLRQELGMLDPEERGEELASALTRSRLHLAHRVLSSFLEAYSVVADRLAARDPAASIDEKEFVAECLAAGRQYLAQNRIHSPESVSSELFGNALKLAANRGLTVAGGEDVAERRRAFAAELSTVIRRLETIGELALRDLRLAAGARAAPAAAGGAERDGQG